MKRYSPYERRLARRIILAKDDRIASEADFLSSALTPHARFLRVVWFLMAVFAYARVLLMSDRLAASTRRHQDAAVSEFLMTSLPVSEGSRN